MFIEALRKGPETMFETADKVMKNPNQFMEDFKRGVKDSQAIINQELDNAVEVEHHEEL